VNIFSSIFNLYSNTVVKMLSMIVVMALLGFLFGVSDFALLAKVSIMQALLVVITVYPGKGILFFSKSERVISSFIVVLELVLLLIKFLIILVFSDLIFELFGITVKQQYIVYLTSCILIFNETLKSLYEREGKYRDAYLPESIKAIFQVIAIASYFFYSFSIDHYLIILLLSEVLMMAYYLGKIKSVGLVIGLERKRSVVEYLRYVYPQFFSGILMFIYWNLDYVFIGLFLSEHELGIYFFAFKYSHIILNLYDLCGRLTFSYYCRTDQLERKVIIFKWVTKISLVTSMLFMVTFIAFGDEVIDLVFKGKWNESIPLFVCFLGLIVYRATTRHWSELYLSESKEPRLNIIVPIIVVFFMTTTIPYFVQKYGMYGAFMSLTVSIVFGSIVFLTYITRAYNLHFFQMLKKEYLLVIVLLSLSFILKTQNILIQISPLTLCIPYILSLRKEYRIDIWKIKR
jgi:O-antigen/teichoic acid export membrane protein